MAQIRRAPSPPIARPFLHPVGHQVTLVLEFGSPHDFAGLLLNDGNPGRLAARIKFESVRMGDGFGCRSILQDDNERLPPKDGRAPLFEQLARSRRMARVKRLLIG
jgi:hypothetical protein